MIKLIKILNELNKTNKMLKICGILGASLYLSPDKSNDPFIDKHLEERYFVPSHEGNDLIESMNQEYNLYT